jgi:hypothetical protein
VHEPPPHDPQPPPPPSELALAPSPWLNAMTIETWRATCSPWQVGHAAGLSISAKRRFNSNLVLQSLQTYS